MPIATPQQIPGYSVWLGPTPAPQYHLVRGVTFGDPIFDLIVNVDDCPGLTFSKVLPQIPKVWLPILEFGVWPLETIHAAIQTLHNAAVEQHKRVYLHCHAGATRSPSVATLWLIAEGKTLDQAMQLVGSTVLLDQQREGRIPYSVLDFAAKSLTNESTSELLKRDVATVRRMLDEVTRNAKNTKNRS